MTDRQSGPFSITAATVNKNSPHHPLPVIDRALHPPSSSRHSFTASMDHPTSHTLEPSSTIHDDSSSPSIASGTFATLVGQRTGDSSSASDTTHSTDTLPSSVGSVEDHEQIAPLPNAAMRKSYHRHMARSAAKRESVAALPSIRDLQIHFSGGGGVQHRVGAGAGIRPSPLGAMKEEPDVHKPWKEVQLVRVHPDQAREEANNLAREVGAQWTIQSSPPDLRAVFVDTASAVRRVRTLAMSLTPPGQRRVSAPQRPPGAFSTPSRPSGVGQSSARVVSVPLPQAVDPAAPLRRAAIDFLGHLRALEERLRNKNDVPTMVIIPENSEPSLVDSPVDETHPRSRSRSLSPTRGANGTNSASCDEDWSEDEDYDVNAAARLAEAARSHPPWEDRILNEARSYRTVSDNEWARESAAAHEAAHRWVDVVGRLFREHIDSPTDVWVVEGNSGMGECGCVKWYHELTADRVHDFLVAHLTAEHAALLPPASDEHKLLDRLTDGYLLAHAFNSYLLTSARPWGFVPDEDVHETLGSDSDSGREWTFRRVENLTCWAA